MTGKKCRIRFDIILFSLIFIFNLSAVAAFAKDAEFLLSIDSLNLQTNASTNLVISLVNAQKASVTEITGLENFDVLSSSQSTSTQIVNGDITNRKDLRYVIIPKQTGTFTLQAKVEYNGQTYLTNALQVTVSESASGEEAEDLFIKPVLSDGEMYLGQKAVLTYELYSRYNIENFGFLDNIAIDGFICADIPDDQLKAGYVYLNGNKYVMYEARQLLLSPMKAGTYTIPAYNFQVNVSTGDFFSSAKPVYLKTKPLELTVKPLPSPPVGFSGVVGKMNVDAAYSRQQLNYGDSLTLRVTASGNCNLDPLTRIFTGNVEGFAVYETQKDTEDGVENNQYHSKKEFEIILVPETTGELNIPPVFLTFFNPETGSYEQAEIPGTTITVLGEVPVAQAPAQSGYTPLETVRIEQVSYNLRDGEYLTLQLKKETVVVVLLVTGVVLILAVAAILFLAWRRKQNNNLHKLYQQIQRSNDRNEIYNLFSAMMRDYFNISLKASTRDAVSARLSDCGFGSEILGIRDALEARSSNADLAKLKNRIREVCKKLKKISKHRIS